MIWSEPPYDYTSMKNIHMAEGDPKAGITEVGVDSPQGIESARKVGIACLSTGHRVCQKGGTGMTLQRGCILAAAFLCKALAPSQQHQGRVSV